MLADFESRLADVLGSRLTGALAGRVFVTPGPTATDRTALLVGVHKVEAIEQTFGAARRPEQVPGASDPRRVVRLRCVVRIEVRPGDDDTRAQIMAAVDTLLYELDAPELRTASALSAPGDPGFLLDTALLDAAFIEPEINGDNGLPAVELRAEGWFWPRNTPGITGVPIVAALVRTATLPIGLQPWPLLIRAGDPALPLTVLVGAAGTGRLTGDTPTVSPFGELALRIVDAGGRPGAGTLSGGSAGPDGARLVTVSDDSAAVTYQPPAAPAADQLVVYVARADTGAGPAVGLELARFPLAVTA
ncbi:hypothetical protein CQY20_09180 [Mycolicibacterium agri]|uniref:Uncharacterized protein n=1 Tax=Mycolicibacterium agri TaxID=36811 RepID=A0A2A7N6N6_MYCAG|nr:hypothetical protein [Mycolicibacterium agri]PEG39715.1 hypothetical protein CQY20_09180 [Mycolicibacterium agri]GFG52578.1 hypothetical protein MAGR_40190 [Mycolicibacterium agri]